MRTCGGAAVRGFTDTQSGVAPPSGVDLPERWVLKRRSGFSSITEHCLGPEIRLRKTPAETQSVLRRNLNPVQLLIRIAALERKSPLPGEQSPTDSQDLDLKQVLDILS